MSVAGLTVYLGVVGLVAGVYYLGDAENPDPGPADRLNSLLIAGPWRLVHRAGAVLFGSRWDRFGSRLDHYFFGQRNRVFTMVYWLLFMGGYGLFAANAFRPEYLPCRYVGGWQQWFGSAYCFSCWGMYVWLMRTDPGVITAASQPAELGRWEYDGIFYEPKPCGTCNWQRPARSKHCRVCNHCVARFDHHCIWINACVGRGNHRLFLVFLLYHAVFMSYVTYAGTGILVAQLWKHQLDQAWYFDQDGRQQQVGYQMMFHWIVRNHSQLFAVTAFCALLQMLFYGFFLYQLGLVVRNITTNETFKLSDLKHAAKLHDAKLTLPKTSPYFVSIKQALQEVLSSHTGPTRHNPQQVWDDPPQPETVVRSSADAKESTCSEGNNHKGPRRRKKR